jgi:DNA-binding winged helix-turn-helix (wHTH) protein
MICDRCRAEITGEVPKMDEQFFKVRNHCVRGALGRLTYLPQYPWEMLTVLWKRSPHIVSMDTLLSRLYGGSDNVPEFGIIRVWVYQVRQALQDTPYVIETIYSQGYRLVHEDEAFAGKTFQRFGKVICFS